MNFFYNKFAEVYYNLIVFRNYIYSKYLLKQPLNYRDIPIIINNRNRLSFLIELVNTLEIKGYHNIIILDNKSTYPPLLDFYSTTKHEVIFLDKNYGFKALEESKVINRFKKNYFVYTDPDVIPIAECPDDFLSKFLEVLIRNPKIQKVGFALKIDDLPDCFDKKKEVIAWESKLYGEELEKNFFYAPIDTTFALHRPLARISTQGRFKHIRSLYPFEARHMPWYNDSKNLSDEEVFYLNSVEIGTHWSTGDGYKNKSFFKRLFHKFR